LFHPPTNIKIPRYTLTMATLKFAPWQSDVDVQFYAALAHIKINHDKLDDSARKVLGLYEVHPGEHQSRSMRVQIHPNALTSDEYVRDIPISDSADRASTARLQPSVAPKASSRTATP
jgi:hypothetical protein